MADRHELQEVGVENPAMVRFSIAGHDTLKIEISEEREIVYLDIDEVMYILTTLVRR